MEIIIDLVKPALVSMLKPLAAAGAKSVVLHAKNIGLLDDLSRDQLNNNIDTILSDKLLDIHNDLQDVLANTSEMLKNMEIMMQNQFTEYQTFSDKVYNLEESLQTWRKYPTSPKARADFCKAYKESNLLTLIANLQRHLTTAESPRPIKLSDQILWTCKSDWRKVNAWKQHICAKIAQVCSLHAHYIWLKYIPLGSPVLYKAKNVFDKGKELILGGQVEIEKARRAEQIQKLQENVEKIMQELQNCLLKAKSNFVLEKKCENPKHEGNCNTCCELGSKIYKYLDENCEFDFADRNLAKELHEKLRRSYPQFEWSVVLFEKRNELPQASRSYFDPQMRTNLWQQTMGTKIVEGIPGLDTKWENSNESNGLQYGRFVCYRAKRDKPIRKAYVFWSEKENIMADSWFYKLRSGSKYADSFNDSLRTLLSKGTIDENGYLSWIPTDEQEPKPESDPPSALMTAAVGILIAIGCDDPKNSLTPMDLFVRDWKSQVGSQKKVMFSLSEEYGPFQMHLAEVERDVYFPIDISGRKESAKLNGTLNLVWFAEKNAENGC